MYDTTTRINVLSHSIPIWSALACQRFGHSRPLPTNGSKVIANSKCFDLEDELSTRGLGIRIAKEPNAVKLVSRMADYKTERGFFALR
jgi:hypothetical protein